MNDGAIQYYVPLLSANIGKMTEGDPKRSNSAVSTPDIQKATPGNIRSLLLDGSQPTLLLGAGASVTSGVPAVQETIERVARWAWCQAHGRSPEDIRVQRSDYWPWLCNHSWFSQEKSLAEQYPVVIQKLLGVKKKKRDFFERLISPGIQPNIGYRCLSRILNEGWISTVLTTNFDHCLEDAKVIENKPHLLVSIKTLDDLVRLSSSPRDPQLIYLHGSVEHYSDKNLIEEVTSLHSDLLQRLVPILSDHPIVVVGYRGAEASIMKDLFQNQCDATVNFAHGVYWCVRENEVHLPLAPMVQELANAIGHNFQLVPIKGFDELFEKDLWNYLIAEEALPIRRIGGFRPVQTPADMRPMPEHVLDDLDSSLLFSRLTQYAKRLGLTAPVTFVKNWVVQEAYARNLLIEQDNEPRPTLAGWLLFSHIPHTNVPQATVRFNAKGPVHWIKRCFGEDVVTELPDGDGNVRVEQEISGNLWAQLDALTDLLSLVNQGFRLKEEISRTVYPFAPVAIKEVLVNALVHRDYERHEPITVTAQPGRLDITSPGGLVNEVAAQTGGQNLQDAIAAGNRGIKGYRNPVISDLFYGGGQMDRAGSGLADVWLYSANNNGEVHFGPDKANRNFHVTLLSRPEAVDEITNTAIPLNSDTVRYAANLIPIEEMPAWVWHAGTTARSAGRLSQDAAGLAVPPGYVQDGRFFSLYDLETLAEVNVSPFDVGDIEILSLKEVLTLPNGENIILKLMNDAMCKHLRALGLYVEYQRRRAYFPKSAEGERKITYRGRVKRSTRTVVKARTRRDSDQVLYYEHKAMAFSVLRFDDDWAISITPCYSFTLDGEGKQLGRDRINVLSTRRAARDFNPSFHHDVSFWAATISEESEGIFALKSEEKNDLSQFAPSILLSSRLPTISFNASSFEHSSVLEDKIDADLEELQEELAALAEEDRQQEGED